MTQSTTEPPASEAPTSLPEWLTYIETMHPAEMELGLERLQSVADKGRWNCFDQPVVTFAGTNGKGSTLAALEALLLAHGLNVAAYTSPHLIRYNERVRINGKPVSDEALVAAFNRVESVRANTPLTYFEMGTLAALALFKEGPSTCARALNRLSWM